MKPTRGPDSFTAETVTPYEKDEAGIHPGTTYKMRNGQTLFFEAVRPDLTSEHHAVTRLGERFFVESLFVMRNIPFGFRPMPENTPPVGSFERISFANGFVEWPEAFEVMLNCSLSDGHEFTSAAKTAFKSILLISSIKPKF